MTYPSARSVAPEPTGPRRVTDAARAVGRFRPDGPLGYKPKSAPDGPLYPTRAEAEAAELEIRERDRCEP